VVSASGIDPGGAWNSFIEAMRLMEEQQLWLHLGDAQILHAHVLARAGLRDLAHDALEQACSLFSRLEAEAVVADINRVLRLLSLGPRTPADPRTTRPVSRSAAEHRSSALRRQRLRSGASARPSSQTIRMCVSDRT